MKRGFYFLLAFIGAGLVIFATAGCTVKEKPLSAPVTLRSEYQTLDDQQVETMIKKHGIFDIRRNKYQSFANRFELKSAKRQADGKTFEEKVIIDHNTRLVWHQSGSDLPLNFDEAKEWLKDFNQRGYCGYYNWRLPTLEEAATLLEGQRINKCYIDPLFSPVQKSIRTGDMYQGYRTWGVSYFHGSIFKVGINEQDYLRPVTSQK